MTEARKFKSLAKRLTRATINEAFKDGKAAARKEALVELGKTVITTEVEGIKTYSFPPEVKSTEPPSSPRLAWLGAKQYVQQGNSRKNRSHNGSENAEASIEHAGRLFAIEVAKAMTPITPDDVTPISVIESPADGLSA